MIGFNTLLRDEEIDPADVKLVRHQSRGPRVQHTPYELWRADDGRFELYQRLQGKDRFADTKFIAAFVATPLNETLFVGMFENCGVGTAEPGLLDPVRGHDVGGYFLYDLRRSKRLSQYRDRLVVDWGTGYRTWVQRAQNQDKPILEIRRLASEPKFPGFLEFRARLSDLANVPNSWQHVLSSVNGIYLLVCPETGKQYVGAAYGENGFWGRWESYMSTGHGGNVGMKHHPFRDYQVSVLEVASSSAGLEQIMEMESRWKEALLTREFGLNEN